MVITITMKNVTKQGDIYHFRISVPEDCQKAVGKKEIAPSVASVSFNLRQLAIQPHQVLFTEYHAGFA